jgi:hypothetical protein
MLSGGVQKKQVKKASALNAGCIGNEARSLNEAPHLTSLQQQSWTWAAHVMSGRV